MLRRGGALWALLLLVAACSGSDSTVPAANTQPAPNTPAQQPPATPPPSPPPTQPPTPTPPPVVPPPAVPPPTANPAGPWPVTDATIYASAQGLFGEIIDAGPDDAQNMWVVTPDSLYVLQPGQTMFKRFTAADGLHVQSFTGPNGRPAVTNITAMAGGRANEVFVGYLGYEGEIPPPAPPPCCVPNADFSDPRWALGQADKVTLNPNGTIQIRRYLFICDVSANCWEERSVRRMIFAHRVSLLAISSSASITG